MVSSEKLSEFHPVKSNHSQCPFRQIRKTNILISTVSCPLTFIEKQLQIVNTEPFSATSVVRQAKYNQILKESTFFLIQKVQEENYLLVVI